MVGMEIGMVQHAGSVCRYRSHGAALSVEPQRKARVQPFEKGARKRRGAKGPDVGGDPPRLHPKIVRGAATGEDFTRGFERSVALGGKGVET